MTLTLIACSSARLQAPPTWRQTAVGIALPESAGARPLTALRPELAAAQATGAKFVRVPVRWDVIEPAPAQYDWSHADELVDLAADRFNLRVMPYVAAIPSWAADDPERRAQFDETFAQRYGSRVLLAAKPPGVFARRTTEAVDGDPVTIAEDSPEALAQAFVSALSSTAETLAWAPQDAATGETGTGADAFAQIAKWFAQPYQVMQPATEIIRGSAEAIAVRGFRLKDGRFIVAAWLNSPGDPAEVRVRFSMPGLADVQMTDARGVRLPESRARWSERWYAVELELSLQEGGVVFAEASPAHP